MRIVKHHETPDGRYVVVRGRLWRMANPSTRNSRLLPRSIVDGLPSREILRQSGTNFVQRPVDLIASDNQRRGDTDRVFMRVLGKDTSALKCLTVTACFACFWVKFDC